jgi:hypothetical protein
MIEGLRVIAAYQPHGYMYPTNIYEDEASSPNKKFLVLWAADRPRLSEPEYQDMTLAEAIRLLAGRFASQEDATEAVQKKYGHE